MGWFRNNEEEEADIRGATTDEMKAMTDEQVIMLGLYRLLAGQGFDDALCDELRERANHRPTPEIRGQTPKGENHE